MGSTTNFMNNPGVISQLGQMGQLAMQASPQAQPMGANLGVATADMGFGQTPINPDLNKLTYIPEGNPSANYIGAPQSAPTGGLTSSLQKEGFNIPQGTVWDEAKGWVTPDQATNAMPSPSNDLLVATGQQSYIGNPVPNQNLQSAQNPYTSTETPSDPYSAARMTSSGNLYGANAATAANRVNQITPYGSLNYQQTGTDAYGNPTYTAIQGVSPYLQNAFGNLVGGVNQSTGQAFNPNLPSTGINPGEEYSSAIMRRLQPIQERQSKQLDTQLAQQGIMPGSEAYNIAKQQLAQGQNDQLTSAIVGGMQTGLQANQQAYNQALTNYQLPLSQLSAFRSATAPSYVNPYQQAAVSGPDLSTAYAQQQATDIARQNADTARQAAMTSGLFSLGGTALSNPTSVSNILSGASGLYNTIKGWF